MRFWSHDVKISGIIVEIGMRYASTYLLGENFVKQHDIGIEWCLQTSQHKTE